MSIKMLAQLGYTIKEDPNPFGMFYWTKGNTSSVSYPSEEEAIAAATKDALMILGPMGAGKTVATVRA